MGERGRRREHLGYEACCGEGGMGSCFMPTTDGGETLAEDGEMRFRMI